MPTIQLGPKSLGVLDRQIFPWRFEIYRFHVCTGVDIRCVVLTKRNWGTGSAIGSRTLQRGRRKLCVCGMIFCFWYYEGWCSSGCILLLLLMVITGIRHFPSAEVNNRCLRTEMLFLFFFSIVSTIDRRISFLLKSLPIFVVVDFPLFVATYESTGAKGIVSARATKSFERLCTI